MTNKVKENYLRRQAERLGLSMQKSRGKKWSVDNQLGYRVIDPYHNTIIQGEKFDLNIQEVEDFLSRRLDEIK